MQIECKNLPKCVLQRQTGRKKYIFYEFWLRPVATFEQCQGKSQFGESAKKTLKFKTFFQVNFSVSFRRLGRTYRQIINLGNIDVCPNLKNMHKFPQFEEELIFANKSTFPGIIHKCPYKSFKVFNSTMSLTYEKKLSLKLPNRQLFPNGSYKNRLAFYDNLDDNIGEITYYFEMYSYADNSDLK
jgi:hypothetical protein